MANLRKQVDVNDPIGTPAPAALPCGWCGGPVPPRVPAAGKPKRYCGVTCRQRACTGRRRLEAAQKPLCAESECVSTPWSKGLCRHHYDIARRAGGFGEFEPCLEGSCERPGTTRGYCGTHYMAARRAGKLGGARCLVPSCSRTATTAGLCSRHYLIKWNYGLTVEQAVDIAERIDAGELCPICKADPVTVIDHCHKTEQMRQLLCSKCNVGIGMLRDDPVVLRAAAAYLEGPD